MYRVGCFMCGTLSLSLRKGHRLKMSVNMELRIVGSMRKGVAAVA
jgi:hypothetical protein